MAREFGAELQILHVTQAIVPLAANMPVLGYAGINQARYDAEIRKGASRQLDEIEARPQFTDIEVTSIVEQGDPGLIIAHVAAREETDLIVVATHGWTGWRNRIFGSVAEKVLRVAPCSVLVSRVQTPGSVNLKLPVRKILCATDWSEPSLQALEVAGEWAAHFGAELSVIHVMKPLESPGLVLSIEQIEKSMRNDAVERLHQTVRERLPQLPKTQALVHSGSAADIISEVADSENADLLVLATQGASGWRAALAGTPVAELLFGSVTNNVLQLTSRPVLTVRTKSVPHAATSA